MTNMEGYGGNSLMPRPHPAHGVEKGSGVSNCHVDLQNGYEFHNITLSCAIEVHIHVLVLAPALFQ